ncbi:protein kinase [Pseudomonas mangiferae]|uniref:Protein kinase n=1 Tax=Pseudomonas mangiferae TaxID=2593654 RepID=A0A553H4U2_9PSED|nr:protein kinase [Pseudomonas mangiferae]
MDASVNPRTQLAMNAETALRSDLPPAGALPAGTRLHEFNLQATLGEGGFSIVYAAHDTQLHRDVAIKEYMPAAFASRVDGTQVKLRAERHRATFEAGLRSFIDEARLLAQFKHRALVEVLRFWEENGTAYMAMPRYSGRTMRHVLKEYDLQCDERWLRSIFAPILDVLELLHAHNVFHRDIAPDNILIQDDGTPVLLDLGSARRVLGDMQHALTVVVKPGYAPIEQYAEDLSVPQGPWTDIYAVGAVLYYAVTGSAPVASVSRMMKDTLEPLAKSARPGYSLEFLRAIDQTLALQPGARPQSIAELRALLGMNTMTWSVTPLGNLHQKSSSAAPQHIDDAKTVVLSAEEMAQLASRFVNLDRPSARAAASEAPTAPTAPLPDPFQTKPAQPVVTNSFPEMDDLLAGDRAHKAGVVAVPGQKKPEPAPAVQPQATPSVAQVPANKDRGGKGVWLSVAAVAALVVIGASGWMLLNRSDDAPSAVKQPEQSTKIDVQQPVAESKKPAEPEVVPPVAKVEAPKGPATPAEAVTPPPQETPKAISPMAEALKADATTEPVPVTPPPVSDPVVAPPADVRPTPVEPTPVARIEPVTQPARPASTPQETQTPPRVTAATNERAAEKPKAPPASAASTTLVSAAVTLNVKPWGEVWVDGQQRGVSPPIKSLDLEPGPHTVELRNPGLPALSKRLTVKAGAPITLQHDFTQAGATRVTQDEPAPTRTASKAPSETAAPQKTAPAQAPAKAPAPAEKPKAPPAQAQAERRENGPRAALGEVEKGVVAFSIRPWGEIWVDGQKRGVSPPLHDLRLPAGTYSIELRNPSFPTYTRKVVVGADQRVNLDHSFD